MFSDIAFDSALTNPGSTWNHVHICGIGGIGMSAVAHLLRDVGVCVTGSDLRESKITQALALRGVEIWYAPDADRIREASCVVISSHFPPKHPEILAAKTAQIPVFDRHEMLGEICRRIGLAPILCMGTSARGKLPRFAAQIPHTGWSAGALLPADDLPHARLGHNIMIDVDERDFMHHPEWFAAFTPCDVLISDWEDTGNYYDANCSLEELHNAAAENLLGEDSVMILPEKTHVRALRFSVWNRSARLETVDFSLEETERRMLSPETGCWMPYFGTRKDAGALAAALLWCRLRNIPIRLSDVEAEGWFQRINSRNYHEIRMHPVHIRSSLDALRRLASGAKLGVVMRPFASTLFAYPESVWRETFALVSQVLLINPPYEGCTERDCEEFRDKLWQSVPSVRCVSREEAAIMTRTRDAYWLWIGAGDILP